MTLTQRPSGDDIENGLDLAYGRADEDINFRMAFPQGRYFFRQVLLEVPALRHEQRNQADATHRLCRARRHHILEGRLHKLKVGKVHIQPGPRRQHALTYALEGPGPLRVARAMSEENRSEGHGTKRIVLKVMERRECLIELQN